jgi:hypothetical protein
LLSAVPPGRDDEGAKSSCSDTRISLEGSASVEAIVVGGLFAEGSIREAPDTWIVASGQVPFCAATVPDAGEYRACAVVVDPRSRLSDVLVDQAPGSYLSGVAHVQAAAGAAGQYPMRVVLHPPKLTDPPLLAVTSLSWLDDQTQDRSQTGLSGSRRPHRRTQGDRHDRPGSTARNPAGGGSGRSRTVTVALAATA